MVSGVGRLIVAIMLAVALEPSASAQEPPQPGQKPPPDITAGLFPEPKLLTQAIEFGVSKLSDTDEEPKNGFYPELGNMITGSGWISIGPGYRHRFANGHVFFDSSTAVSWRGYKEAQARLELRHLAADHLIVGSQIMWQDLTQVKYFGLGPSSLKANISNYRLKYVDFIGYVTVRLGDYVSVGARAGQLNPLKVSTAAGWFIGHPDTQEIFTDASAPGLFQQPTFLYADASLTADSRNNRGHPIRGGFYRVAWETFSDRDHDVFSFQRYEVEGGHFVPLGTEKWILALRGWGVLSDAGAGQMVPFYLLPALGGQNTLRGYPDYRFHDRALFAFTVESRWALMTHVDGAAFVDTGNVGPTFSDLSWTDRKNSIGGGVRLHANGSTFARFDVGHSKEGWRFIFKLNDPMALARSFKRPVVVPFVP
jgi:hypothetical protein